jgi:hypothetical protein
MRKTFALITGMLALVGWAVAQTTQNAEKPQHIVIQRHLEGDQTKLNPIFLLNELDGIGKLVKGAPYTANAVTETTQTLADGNRIVNKTTAVLARDSEGRTRREESFPKVGGLQANASKVVMINDPAAHVQYMSKPGEVSGGESGVVTSTDSKVMVRKLDGLQARERVHAGGTPLIIAEAGEEASSANVKHESLGAQVIEGINVEGARDTRTIPAGAIGNEKPIVITSETWTSPELQIVVLSKRSDPRFGETVYKLTEINRAEPDPSLFQIPNNVKKELPAAKY